MKKITRLSTLGIIAVLTLSALLIPKVKADQFQDQINQLSQQNTQNQQQVSQLQVQANSYQDAIDKLQAQIVAIEQQISDNQAKSADLQKQITAAEDELTKQRRILGENIKTMYLEGQITTVEMLASSKDLSQFIDKQEYHNSVQTKIKDTLDKITALKLKLKSQKDEVDQLLKDEQTMQTNLSKDQAQQSQLLALTQTQKDQYTQAIQANNTQIASLRAQQAAENAKHFRGYSVVPGHNGNDTYPDVWRLAGQDTLMDSWGMYNRECVSYTAWKVASSGRNMPYWGGEGNANQWPGDARQAGIPVDSTPRAGDVAIAFWGSFGHAMYVDSVNANGTINISQYNWDYNGTYSEIYNFNPSGLSFIHF